MANVVVRDRRTTSNAVFAIVKSWLSRLTDSSTPLFPIIPKPIKLLFFLFFLLHSPSWPFAWHIRVWYYPLKAYYEVYTKGRKKYIDDFERDVMRKGGVQLVTRTKRLAWVDDCDYNMHLSNSCYAKNADASRMKWCIEALAPLFTPGCHMAMGGSHYIFIKEVPIGSEYVMETKLGGWDEKWFFLVTEFVIYPKKKGSRKEKANVKEDVVKSPVIPSISAPPSGDSTPANVSRAATPPSNVESVKKAAALRARAPRSDGGVVCAVVITEYCTKAGRITVPARIALHFSMLSNDKAKRDRVRDILFKTKDMGAKWMRGGWKDEPDAATLGMEIGHDGLTEASEPAEWVQRAREGIEKVNEGLGVF